ncbi:30S ribosomal protein S8 [Candidatus Saccharibacteria bacterium CG_4_10_14_0_2_um_filter_52_9]|nr:MAG: 30S ribosomal protein S8 [Candidatus Saccharibacteria bacterium CG_4_10_14_0_2_um_filter_52_9]
MSTTTTDPIADMLTRIRNAILVRKLEVSLPHSKIKESVARLLQESNFVDHVSVSDAPIGKVLTVRINNEDSNARITEIVRLSKPGRRYYVNAQDIPIVKRGRGLVIISTSKGLMTGDKARDQKVGGELICKVY